MTTLLNGASSVANDSGCRKNGLKAINRSQIRKERNFLNVYLYATARHWGDSKITQDTTPITFRILSCFLSVSLFPVQPGRVDRSSANIDLGGAAFVKQLLSKRSRRKEKDWRRGGTIEGMSGLTARGRGEETLHHLGNPSRKKSTR